MLITPQTLYGLGVIRDTNTQAAAAAWLRANKTEIILGYYKAGDQANYNGRQGGHRDLLLLLQGPATDTDERRMLTRASSPPATASLASQLHLSWRGRGGGARTRLASP